MPNVSIRMLGELTVLHDGEPVPLPPSKRTRALMAYLARTARPHRRDRLCEVLWGLADDPRGALRWSLSKMRPLVNDQTLQRLVADRERVALLTSDIDIDAANLMHEAEKPDLSVDEILRLCQQLEQPFLEGADLPDLDVFQQWLTAERADIDRLRGRLLARLARHEDLTRPEQLEWALAWEALEPFNPRAATQVVTLLDLLGRTPQLARWKRKLAERFRNAGIAWSPSARADAGKAERDICHHNEGAAGRALLARQAIRFCTARDGARIAYAWVGKGVPIIKAANWLSHLEYDWDAPIWSPLFRQLATDHQVVRYDERGNGLSDWDVDEISFDSFVTDLETVVGASGLDRFALLGISQGAAVSIAYAVRYPERVSHLILFGGYAAGWRIGAQEALMREREAVITLTESGWGQDNPAYRQIFSSTFMPDATASELTWFNEFQRLTTSPANAAHFLSVFGDIDVRDLLARVTVPTLVIHSLGDQRIPVQVGRDIAAAIPNAEFVGLESNGHLLLGREPASQVFVDRVRAFIDPT